MRRRKLLLVVASLGFVLLFPPARATAQTSPDFGKALYRYMPVMKFDSEEPFFPVRAKSITDNPGNELQRADETVCGPRGCATVPGEVLARRNADGTGLNIGYLVGTPPGIYPHISKPVRDDDRIDEQGRGFDNAKQDAQKFQTSSAYRDRIYGHIKPVYSRGYLAGAWLEYWFFYYYNHFIFDDHEGDWEMVQIFVDTDLKPQVAVYAQHNGQTYCPWAKLPHKERGRPVVFVAQGSHASYFTPGAHPFFHDLVQDYTDGQLKRPIRLIRIADKRPQWLNWPGSWGASKRVSGPKSHDQYDHPQQFYEDAPLDGDCK
jgi:hypothetical protein